MSQIVSGRENIPLTAPNKVNRWARRFLHALPGAVVVIAGGLLIGLGVDLPLRASARVSSWWWLAVVIPSLAGVVAAQVLIHRARGGASQAMRRAPLNLAHITTRHLHNAAQQALTYRDRTDRAAGRFVGRPMQARMCDIADRVDVCVRQICALAEQIDACYQATPTLTPSQQPHPATPLTELIARAELQLEVALASLGALYSKVLLMHAREVDGSKFHSLQQHLDEQIDALRSTAADLESARARSAAETEQSVALSTPSSG